ncbi:MAG TPA: glycosyltransferase family 2 protein [Candidatus Limnocylindrales bacterium]
MAASSPAGPAPPELSVIVPAWNAADSIERALGTVLADPDADVECVVVDDASTDATVSVVERMAASDPRIVLIRSPRNGGASAARNLALDQIRGTWVTFLDADDILTDVGVEALLGPTRMTDPLAVIGQRVWSDGTKRWVSSLYDIPDIREPGRKSMVSAPGLVYYASATGKAFHRSLVGDLRFEGRVLGDQPWALRALLRAGDRIEVVPEDVYVWLRAPTEMTDPRSITATTRSTARGSADAVRVAITAHAQVSAEAYRTIDDPAAQRLVARVYLERLLRSDLGMYLKRALDRHDPAIAELLVAFGAFLESVPRDLLAEEGPLVTRTLLKPLVDAWLRLPPDARNAFWGVVRPTVAADPSVYDKLGGGRVGRTAIRLVSAVDTAPTRAFATAATDRAAQARTHGSSPRSAPPAVRAPDGDDEPAQAGSNR